MQTSPQTKTVVIAGATGFVGRALVEALRGSYQVVALSRHPHPPQEGVQWRPCDLFSPSETQEALRGADLAVYLVHSMLPSSRLTQASFMDLDLLAADNFARAAARHDVQRIVYLGGLLPGEAQVSRHLQSRLEVEQALGGHQVPVTSLRAGLILGAEGSSARLLLSLVERLPALPCPPWTQHQVQPVALRDVVQALAWALREAPGCCTSYRLVGPEPLSYCALLARTAQAMGLKRRQVETPALPLAVEVAGVCAVTGAPRELVRPLMESLRHSMASQDDRLWRRAGLTPTPLDEALRQALLPARRSPRAWASFLPTREAGVRSVQRMKLPPGRNAQWAYREFMRWIPTATMGTVEAAPRASQQGHDFLLRHPRAPLLQFTRQEELCSPDRVMLCIDGGQLARAHPSDRMEFRQVLGDTLLVAIHDYQPRLWWLLYLLTQAPVHQRVMEAFGRHLERQPALPIASAGQEAAMALG